MSLGTLLSAASAAAAEVETSCVTGTNTVVGVQAEALVAKSKYSTKEYIEPKAISSKMTKMMSARRFPEWRPRWKSSELD